MQDKPHIAAHKIKAIERIHKLGRFASLLLNQQYNAPNMRTLRGHFRKQLID